MLPGQRQRRLGGDPLSSSRHKQQIVGAERTRAGRLIELKRREHRRAAHAVVIVIDLDIAGKRPCLAGNDRGRVGMIEREVDHTHAKRRTLQREACGRTPGLRRQCCISMNAVPLPSSRSSRMPSSRISTLPRSACSGRQTTTPDPPASASALVSGSSSGWPGDAMILQRPPPTGLFSGGSGISMSSGMNARTQVSTPAGKMLPPRRAPPLGATQRLERLGHFDDRRVGELGRDSRCRNPRARRGLDDDLADGDRVEMKIGEETVTVVDGRYRKLRLLGDKLPDDIQN